MAMSASPKAASWSAITQALCLAEDELQCRVLETTSGRGDERLVRAIGLPTLTANIINLTIGAGIFVLPAFAAAGLGAAAPAADIACAVLLGVIVPCFAAARRP